MLWQWRNDPVSRANSSNDEAVPLAQHEEWFAATLRSSTRRIYIGNTPDLARIGMVRFDQDADRAIVSLNVAPEARGRGLSTGLLETAIEALFRESPDVMQLVAEIRESNTPSLRVFARAGFAPRTLSNGVWTYVRQIASSKSHDSGVPGTASTAKR